MNNCNLFVLTIISLYVSLIKGSSNPSKLLYDLETHEFMSTDRNVPAKELYPPKKTGISSSQQESGSISRVKQHSHSRGPSAKDESLLNHNGIENFSRQLQSAASSTWGQDIDKIFLKAPK